ncbi:PilZ domain-containing protein [bacterium]|nr:PilZ domain-containing protein [bacterium]
MLKDIMKGFLSLVQRPTPDWDFGERRKLIRMRCHYKTQVVLDSKKLDGVITDMGVGGLRLKVFQTLKPGQILTVHSPFNEVGEDGAPVDCKVVWQQQPEKSFVTYAGLVYATEAKKMGRTWVRGVMKQLGFRPESLLSKRNWVRAECILEGTVKRADNSRHEIRIQNLGVGGALFEYRDKLPLGEMTIRIGPYDKLPGLDVSGTLVKARPQGRHFLYGIEFGEMKPAQLRMLTVYLKTFLNHTWEV